MRMPHSKLVLLKRLERLTPTAPEDPFAGATADGDEHSLESSHS